LTVDTASPGDRLSHVEAWVTSWVDDATSQLLSGGETIISTSRGTVHAHLDRPSLVRGGMLRTSTMGDNGVDRSSRVSLSRRGEEELRDEISLYLTAAVIELVGG
jgi:hypothetical protein